MKKLKSILLIIILIAIAGAAVYLWLALPIISGYGAKNLCSCVFISKRAPQDVIDQELSFSLIKYGTYKVSYEDSSATGTVLGLGKRKAVYRKGLGCTLLVDVTEEELRDQPVPIINYSANDTLPWPMGNRFPDSIPASVDQNNLARIVTAAFRDSTYGNFSGTRGIVIVKDGFLVAERYKPPFTPETPQLGWSMTKSITGGLIGILIKDGSMALDQKGLIESWKDTPRQDIYIDDLLRMSSGLDWNESYGGVSTATNMLYKSHNTGLYAAKKPLEHEPGKVWLYSSGTTNILSLMIKQSMPLNDYMQFPHQRLFQKLNMTSAVMEPDASGTYVASSYMYSTPRDWAKYGLLILNDGEWNGERILPEGWVEYSSELTLGSNGEYGAHFWLNKGNSRLADVPEDIIIMSGFQGQRVFILPSKNMVIVRLGFDPEERFDFNAFVRDILQTVK